MSKRFFSASLAVGCLLLLSMSNAGAWTIEQSYDNEIVGATCKQWGSTGSVVSNDESASGNKSCKQSIIEGKTAFGEWGGVIPFPSRLSHGDELWIRLRTYFPNGFNYDSTTGGNRLKFLRVRTFSGSGDGRGYNDWYINPESNSSPFSFIYESRQDLAWNHVGSSSDKIKRGTWETYEYYIKFDTASVSEGGSARMRAWKNGILLEDMTDRVTMLEKDFYAKTLYIFTYWNGGSPKTQSMYIDDLIITNQRPLNTDTLGNPHIGTGGFVQALSPLPPSLSVQ